MPEKLANLSFLVLGAIDDFAHVEQLQLLLKIGLSEANHPSEEACERLALLVDVYAAQVKPWIKEVRFGLKRIKRQVMLPTEEIGGEGS